MNAINTCTDYNQVKILTCANELFTADDVGRNPALPTVFIGLYHKITAFGAILVSGKYFINFC